MACLYLDRDKGRQTLRCAVPSLTFYMSDSLTRYYHLSFEGTVISLCVSNLFKILLNCCYTVNQLGVDILIY